MSVLQEHQPVILLANTSAKHYQTHRPIILPRGCGGTIVDDTIGEFALVEFADVQGRAFAIESILVEHLMPIVHEPLEDTALV